MPLSLLLGSGRNQAGPAGITNIKMPATFEVGTSNWPGFSHLFARMLFNHSECISNIPQLIFAYSCELALNCSSNVVQISRNIPGVFIPTAFLLILPPVWLGFKQKVVPFHIVPEHSTVSLVRYSAVTNGQLLNNTYSVGMWCINTYNYYSTQMLYFPLLRISIPSSVSCVCAKYICGWGTHFQLLHTSRGRYHFQQHRQSVRGYQFPGYFDNAVCRWSILCFRWMVYRHCVSWYIVVSLYCCWFSYIRFLSLCSGVISHTDIQSASVSVLFSQLIDFSTCFYSVLYMPCSSL